MPRDTTLPTQLEEVSWRLKDALVADFVDRHAPHRFCAALAIRCPPINPVKALCTNVARKYPYNGMPKSEIQKASPSRTDKCHANTAAPMIGINVKGTQLSMVRHIQFARWRCGGKSVDHPCIDRNDRPRFERVEATEVIPLCSILGTKLIEIIIRKQRAVGGLP